jgi:hypothetical protein
MSPRRTSREFGSSASMRRTLLLWLRREFRFICRISVRACNAEMRMAGFNMKANALIEERQTPPLKGDIEP